MRIKKLEITGFKSFVDRTVVHFDEDTVGIVGPNGCGKSNIVDAIRWAMGEQSARHLRGRQMQDVIFSGSDSRGPMGMAEVTLVFDNSDPTLTESLPLEYKDYAEIAVTRRLFRDGTSEYLINKTQVRLKDITDLFLGTGVGTKAYSIVEQGRIGLIVTAKPEDRRMLIEEAAGITKYKARKRQAEQKMDHTRQNLLRVGDIVKEIERNLAALKRQASKAERYVAYRQELEDLVLHEGAHRFLDLHVQSQYVLSELATVTESESRLQAELGAADGLLEGHRQETAQLQEEAEKAANLAFENQARVQAAEADLARLKDRLENLQTRSAAAASEQAELSQTQAAISAEHAELVERLHQSEAEEAGHAERALAEHETLATLRESEVATDKELAGLKSQQSTLLARAAAAKAALDGFEHRSVDLNTRRQSLHDESAQLTLSMEEGEARRAALTHQRQEILDGKRITQEQAQELDIRMKALREGAVEQDRELETAKGDLSAKRNRLRALEEIHRRLEGVGQGTKALLCTESDVLLGLVADRMDVPEAFTQAFAALMGERLQAVIVSDVERAAALLGDLRTASAGRAMVVPAFAPYVAGLGATPVEGPGILGRLADQLIVAPEDRNIVQTLVGDALVVESDAAAQALRAQGVLQTLVTLEGTVFSDRGTISGGSGDAVAAAMIEQKREMRELHEVIAVEDVHVTALLERRQTLRVQLAETGAAIERARAEAHHGDLAMVTAEKDLKRAEDELKGMAKRAEQVGREAAQIEGQLQSLTVEVEAGREALAESNRTSEALGKSVAEAELSAADQRARVAHQQSIVTDRKVVLAQIQERTGGLRNTASRLQKSLEELQSRIARTEAELVQCAEQSGETAARLVLAKEELLTSMTAAQAADTALSTAKQSLDASRAALAEREAALKAIRDSLSLESKMVQEHQMTSQRLALELEHLLGAMRDRFRGLDIRTVVGDYHARAAVDAAHKERISELTGLIDRMGPVNVDALREHAETEERYTFYTSQVADLEQALADLEKAIQQMNRESRRLFRETFDSVNAKFQVLFPKMFRGGAAQLRLTNPEDLLETGIEILAQPPGKKLGNIELMSGGEKALTAVSLIFAIFQHRPSPFCILDEVDAPLDEANVARYNEAIRSMTDSSQFILITHIKKTMQSVDILYGVTMQEPGVSKLVGVRVGQSGRAKLPAAEAVETPAVAVA